MHVLVTGGTGFIGARLCRELFGRGHTVTVLTRRPARAGAILGGGVRAVAALADYGPRPLHAVVNLAGEPLAGRRWTPEARALFRSSRIELTRHLIDWLGSRPDAPGVLVSGSAIGYYGSQGDRLLDEESPPGTDFAAELCRDWEAEALRAETLGVRVCRLRTGMVLGPEGGALAKMLTPFRLGLGGRLGDGRQWQSWIRRADLVRLILWLMEDSPTARGAYNGTTPSPVTNAEFTRALGHAVKRPAVLPAPAFALKALLGDMAPEVLLASQRVLPAHAVAEGFLFRYPTLTEALSGL